MRTLLHSKVHEAFVHPQFTSDVTKPLNIENIIDQEVMNLSGGELQRVALVLCMGQPADIYLIDEVSVPPQLGWRWAGSGLGGLGRRAAAAAARPHADPRPARPPAPQPSAYLDSEQRIIAAKVIKRFILHAKKTAFVVEHDFIMATYLADRVIVYEGEPGKQCTANAPQTLLTGMNMFLKQLEVTFRRDPTNYRPRINKRDSVKDREQKLAGKYFFLEAED